jgi:hypothetical protein
MKVSTPSHEPRQNGRKLRNFDLTVEEIKIIKVIDDMKQTLKSLESANAGAERVEYFRSEIKKQELKLEEVRENTLIR